MQLHGGIAAQLNVGRYGEDIMKASDFNIEYFKAIRDEITKRIQIHFRLVLAKFALAGILFAYLHGKSVGISPFLVAGVFAFLFDIVILGNLGWIRAAGTYVRCYIEDIELPIVKWEHDFAQVKGVWTCFSLAGYLLGIWIVGPALCLGYFVLDFDWTIKVEVFLFGLAWYLAPYTAYLAWRNLLREPETSDREKRDNPVVPDAISPNKGVEHTR